MPRHLKIPSGTKISDAMKKRLKTHRDNHIKNGNEKDKVSKHMTSMRQGLRSGMTFSKSHQVAQEKYFLKL